MWLEDEGVWGIGREGFVYVLYSSKFLFVIVYVMVTMLIVGVFLDKVDNDIFYCFNFGIVMLFY